MIKKNILAIILMSIALCGFSQVNLDHLMIKRAPNCEDIAYNSTYLIINYVEKQDIDSAKLVLNYWQSNCGNNEAIIRTKILFAIKEKSFNETIYDSTIIGYILDYMDRMESSKTEQRHYYNYYYGLIPIKGDYDNFTQKLANELIPLQKENSVEQLYCKFYANILKNPITEFQNNSNYNNTNVKKYYNNAVNKYKDKPDMHYCVFTGVWIPTGNAKLLGNHPLLGLQGGIRCKKTTYNLTMYFKFIDSQKDYQIKRNGKLDTTSYFFGGFVGGDVEREIFKFKRSQFDLLGGIAWDGFDAVKTNVNDDNPNNDEAVTINSFNINFGVGYKYYFLNKKYIAIQGRYNFVNYINKGGTNMSGNSLTLSLLVGGFINNNKDWHLNALRYNE